MEALNFYEQEIVLENDHVKLIPFTEAYEVDLRKIIFDEELSFSVNCKTNEDVRDYVRKTMKLRKNSVAYPFIVIDKQTNEIAGSTRFGHISFENKRLEIGWTWYERKFRGTGLNKACKFELLKYAFEIMKFRRIQFSADIDNLRSQKAILKLGASREGVFRRNYINAEGESRDDVYFSVVDTEWKELQSTIFKEYVGDKVF